jgi:drug/metabolite transporter (DMT)-like permease
VWASRLLLLFGLLVLVHFFVASVNRVGATLTDLGLALLVLVVAALGSRGLRRRARWAWVAALLMAVTTLFFVAPLTGTMLLGGGVDPVGTGWDVVFFPMVTLIHLALLGLLARTWHEMERRPDDTGE